MTSSLEAAGTSVAKKRKRNVLTIDQKLEICKLVDAGIPFLNAMASDVRPSVVHCPINNAEAMLALDTFELATASTRGIYI